MKKSVRTIIYLMIVVVIAGGIYLWSRSGGEGVLNGLDPASYDVEATCLGVENHNLVCNAGSDVYLYLDDVQVFLQKADTQIREDGDEETSVSYAESSLKELQEKIEKEGEVAITMWLTKAGKVKTMMIVEESFENNSKTLKLLEGLDPDSYTAANIVLNMDKDGARLAPINYTSAEKDKFAGYIKEYAFARDVRFYREQVKLTMKDEEVTGRNIRYAKLSYKQAKSLLSAGNASVYVWFNQYGNISNMMICTEETVRE